MQRFVGSEFQTKLALGGVAEESVVDFELGI